MATEQLPPLSDEELDRIWRTIDRHQVNRRIVRSLVAEVRSLRKLLGEWADLHDDACRFDHHGVCQAHFVERDCIVDRTRGTLGRWRLYLSGEPHEQREGG